MKKINALFLFPLAIIISSCGESYSFVNKTYPTGTIVNYEKDNNVVLDGKEDDVYKNLESFEFYEPLNGVTLFTKVYFGTYGWWFYTYVNDTSVMFNSSKEMFQNDGIEMHVSVAPDKDLEIENLELHNKCIDTTLQIRTTVDGNHQTWIGNGLSTYEWTMYYVPCEVAVYVDGKLNEINGAKGYGTEIYLPYSAFGLDNSELISIMPSFNNSSSNLDTSRKWFTKKGMSHNTPSSWVRVNKDGEFVYPGKGVHSKKNIEAKQNDEYYVDQKSIELIEVSRNNVDPEVRANFYTCYDERGVYLYASVYDKNLTRYNDTIWDNDGIEFMIDTNHNSYSDTPYKSGLYRFAVDVDQGYQSDIYKAQYYNPIPYLSNVECKVNIEELEDPETQYFYNYLYTYEVFVPFESIGISIDEADILYMAFAVKTPGEVTYIKDRKNGIGQMEGQDWLWVDHHYPINTLEYFQFNDEGFI